MAHQRAPGGGQKRKLKELLAAPDARPDHRRSYRWARHMRFFAALVLGSSWADAVGGVRKRLCEESRTRSPGKQTVGCAPRAPVAQSFGAADCD